MNLYNSEPVNKNFVFSKLPSIKEEVATEPSNKQVTELATFHIKKQEKSKRLKLDGEYKKAGIKARLMQTRIGRFFLNPFGYTEISIE